LRMEGQAKLSGAILKEARILRKVDWILNQCLSIDISNNRESVPIRLFNEKMSYLYSYINSVVLQTIVCLKKLY
jgi:hypothetical protein